MIDYFMLDRVSDKSKEILDIEKFVNTEILIDTYDKLLDDTKYCDINDMGH